MNVQSHIRRMTGDYSPPFSRTTLDMGDFQADERMSPKRGPLLIVDGLMDQTPHTAFEDMPISRLYPLFTRMGVSSICVVSHAAAFKGIITRQDLTCANGSQQKMQPCQNFEEAQHVQDVTSGLSPKAADELVSPTVPKVNDEPSICLNIRNLKQLSEDAALVASLTEKLAASEEKTRILTDEAKAFTAEIEALQKQLREAGQRPYKTSTL